MVVPCYVKELVRFKWHLMSPANHSRQHVLYSETLIFSYSVITNALRLAPSLLACPASPLPEPLNQPELAGCSVLGLSLNHLQLTELHRPQSHSGTGLRKSLDP